MKRRRKYIETWREIANDYYEIFCQIFLGSKHVKITTLIVSEHCLWLDKVGRDPDDFSDIRFLRFYRPCAIELFAA